MDRTSAEVEDWAVTHYLRDQMRLAGPNHLRPHREERMPVGLTIDRIALAKKGRRQHRTDGEGQTINQSLAEMLGESLRRRPPGQLGAIRQVITQIHGVTPLQVQMVQLRQSMILGVRLLVKLHQQQKRAGLHGEMGHLRIKEVALGIR